MGEPDPRDYSPGVIMHCFDLVKKGITYKGKVHRIPQATLDGIIGNEEHYANGGYHVPRHAVASSDYSVQHWADRRGNKFAASALDIALPHGPGSLMTQVSHRLYQAMHNRDPRVRGLVEFGGTLDGKVTFAFYRYSHTSDTGTWDSSHLEHVHISGQRRYVGSQRVWKRAAKVIVGVPMTRTEKLWAAASRKRHGVKAI